MKRTSFILIYFLLISMEGSGQQAESKPAGLSLPEYLSRVKKGNLGYIAEQFNISIAEAQIKAAKIFPDPELSMAYSNNEDQTKMMGQGLDAAISYPFSLGNKRKTGVALAKSQKELARSALDAYFQNMRAEAALAYFSVLKQKDLLTLQQDIYDKLCKLAESDSLRLNAGLINETDARQTALEAKSWQNQVFEAEAGFRTSLAQLAQYMGETTTDTLSIPSGEFPLEQRSFSLSLLVQSALEHRSDLQMAIRNKEISEKQLKLIQANRAFEFSLDAGYAHSTLVKNEIAPAPAFNSFSTGITIPLKFSGLNHGETEAARISVKQSEMQMKDIQLQIMNEVTLMWYEFKASEKKLYQFRKGLLEDAEKILEARTYAYQRGETGLIDLLNAQGTYNDLQVEYCEVLYAYTTTLISLEKASGIWDIE